MNLIYVVLIIMSFALIESRIEHFNTTANGFPKVVWSYWDQGLGSASFFTKLCIKHRDKIALQSGWTHISLSRYTLHQYIDLQEVEKYLNMSSKPHIQLKVDLIRLLLILKYGGLWLDINSYFLTDISQMENCNQSHIKNQLGFQPQLILAAFTESQSEGTYRTHKSGKVINIFPIYENWMIMGKPNNQFWQDCLKIYVQTHQKTKEIMDAQNIQNGIIFKDSIQSYYFIASDYIEQIAIQRKQKELWRQNSSLFAVQYYRLWHMEANEGPFKIFLEYDYFPPAMWADLSTYPTSQFESADLPVFRKFIGWLPDILNIYLNNYAAYNCWGLQFFIEEGSEIRDKLFANAQDQPFMHGIFEVEQNTASKDYCRALQMKKMSYQSYTIISIIYWVKFFMISLTIWCCYRVVDKQGKQKQNLANNQ